ncbi:cell division protein [Lamprobacter modestohalophilus]|uniref:Peptidoglycan D,D-transpeptidase FtsI n=1 Tax=Lamprobacter modestohalophilus TaxID=1064514 RepID=A0A9X0W518_9GAMM|nr:penicillin-binding transpeptidase domain-containing protein [Lamprobacter modestohalophilus]MBK1616985.1 cell division protein [Lamprobacter modestohalophilus]MCF7977677.1 penicillin-binding protein 2 [Chromatiaceae bacterium]MCF7994011.1 penicillin-binding protein 2 [Chromatiaceae bacterium]MCF8016543.1 penicillin-binding protein 2 [Chromatiaceae bacterium]
MIEPSQVKNAYQRLHEAERQRRKKRFGERRFLIGAALVMAFVSVTASAFYRQVVETDFLQDEGAKRFLRDREIPARRGIIMDRNHQPLAISTSVATIWADPQLLAERSDALEPLARALEEPTADLAAKVSEYAAKGRRYMYLQRRVEPHRARAVEDVVETYRLNGIGMETEYRRFYPGGEIFSQVVGFTNIDNQGQEGIELVANNALKAAPGKRRVIQDGHRRIVEEVEQLQAPEHGEDIVLSIDQRLQFLAYRELKRAVEENKAVGGSATLLDVTTGEILALVNQPSFNPNQPRQESAEERRNRALTDVFEPGSTVKPFVVAAALERGLVHPHSPISTSPGVLQVGRNRVRDYRNLGQLDTTSVITKSSNVGVVKIAQQMDRAVLWQLYRRLGFGQTSNVGFPGERSGYLPHFDGWSNFEHATLAFGYGLNVTTLQLAQAYAIIATDGISRPATLLRRDSVPAGERVFAPETAQAVRLMLETVISTEGTARRAAIPGYRVAGKTGTAKKATERGYVDGKYQSVFVGLAPVTSPRFVMVVMIDEPGGKEYYGGAVAAPTFARVMPAALRLYNVAPDDPKHPLILTSSTEGKP